MPINKRPGDLFLWAFLFIFVNMISGNKRKKLTIDSILEKVTEYDIYKHYVGDFTIGKCISSPFREDSRPSFSIGVTKSGRLRHTDFGDTKYSGSCIDFVMQLHNLTFPEALQKVERDLLLSEKKPFCTVVPYSPEELKKVRKIIYVVPKKFTQGDLEYWGRYQITEDELKQNHIYSVDRVNINGHQIPPEKLRYVYHMGEHVKIYSPAGDREFKWLSNVPIDFISGVDLTDFQVKSLIITKSKKDEIVLRKVYENVISVQNESKEALSANTVKALKEIFGDNIYLAFDNDKAGKENSQILCEQYGLRPIFVPDEYYPIKDYAELIKYRGLKVLREEVLKQMI